MHLSVGKEVKKYAWSVDFAIAHFRSSSLYTCDEGKYANLIDTMIKVLQDWSNRWSEFESSKSFLNHRSFLSEMEECVVPLQTLLDVLQRRTPTAPIVVVDLCSGKGFLSIMLSYLANEIPLLKQHISKILMVDSCFGRGKNSINTDYLNVVETDRPRQIPVGCVSGNVFDPWFVRALSNLIHGPPEFMSDITAVPVFKGSFTLTDIRKRLPIESLREMLAERGGDTTGSPEDIRSRLIEICLSQPDTGLDPCSRRFEFHSGADYMSRFVVKGACRDWNRGACAKKRLCKFKHVCAHCAGQDHPAALCPLLPESTKQAISSSTPTEEVKTSAQAVASLPVTTTHLEPFLPKGLVPALALAHLQEISELQPSYFAPCLASELKSGDISYVEIDGWCFVAECLSNEENVVKVRLPVCPQYVQASDELKAKFASNSLELSGKAHAVRVASQAIAAAVSASAGSATTVSASASTAATVSTSSSSSTASAPSTTTVVAAIPPEGKVEVVFLAVHLCQRLSPRCVEIFNSVANAFLLVLAPCCLPPQNMAPMTFGPHTINPIDIHAAENPYEEWVSALLLALGPAEKGIVRVPLSGGVHRRNCYTYATKTTPRTA